MSLTNTDNGVEAISCVECGYAAAAVVVHANCEPHPYCPECRERQIDYGGREYPVGEFYTLHNGPETSTMCPDAHEARIFESGEGGSPNAWIEAKTPADAQEAFVRLQDNV